MFRDVWGCVGCRVVYGTVWGYRGLYGAVWDFMGGVGGQKGMCGM